MKIRVHRSIQIPVSRLAFVTIYVLLIILSTIGLFHLNTLEPADLFLSQKVNKTGNWKHDKSKVLGVEISEADLRALDWKDLFSKIGKAKAKTIITTLPFKLDSIPSNLRNRFIVGLSKNFLNKKNNSKISYLEENEILWGAADPWQNYKSQYERPLKQSYTNLERPLYQNLLNTNSIKTVDLVAFQKEFPNKTLKKDFYLINNVDGYRRIPIMTLTEFSNALQIKDLLKEKVIILGRALDSHPVLSTINSIQDPISQTHYWSLALDSLISQNDLHRIDLKFYSLIVILFLFINLFFQMYFTPLVSFTFFTLSNVSLFASATALLNYENIALPLSGLFLSNFLICVIYNLDVRSYTSASIKDFNLSLKTQLNTLGIDNHNLGKQNFWNDILKYFTHSLDLKKIALVEESESHKKLNLISTYNCTLETLNYQIKNKRKPPFDKNLESLTPHQLSNKAFKTSSESNIDFIVPLRKENKCLGYIFLSIDKYYYQEIENKFPNLIKTLSEYITHLLILKKYNRSRGNFTERTLRFFKNEHIDKKMYELETLSSQLNKTFDFLSSYAFSISSGSAVYDLFGNLVFTNKKMKHLMNECKVGINELSAPLLISELTGMANDSTLAYFRKVLLDKKTVDLPAILSIPHKWKANTYDHVEANIRIKTISTAGSNESQTASSILIEVIQNKSSQELTSKRPTQKNKKPIKTNSFEDIFNIAISKHSTKIKSKEIEVKVMTDLKFPVKENTRLWTNSFDYFFNLLVEDAKPGSNLYVHFYYNQNGFKTFIESDGFGLVSDPNKNTQAANNETEELLSILQDPSISVNITNFLGKGTSIVIHQNNQSNQQIKIVEDHKSAA